MGYDCYCDYDQPSFWSQSFPKARKEHSCEECGRKILPGETYEYVSGLWDDWFDTFKTCQHCVDIRTFVKNSVPCFCWAHGNLMDDVKETLEEASYRAPDEMKGVQFAVGRLMVKRKHANPPTNHGKQ